MLDARLRPLIDPPLNALGRRLAAAGVSADAMTFAGFGLGLAAALAIAFGQFLPGAGLIVLNRLADGLDGAIARATRKTDRGGYLDIVLDFAFYGAVPLAFILADPARNAVAGAALLLAFHVNGASFLGFAAIAARRGIETASHGEKSLYFTAGLAEGAETIAVFLAFCAFPGAFAPLAYGFSALTAITAASRIALACRHFAD
ncbi:MAG: CDP-alcohol phosphatidyltransferase family protein [Hyphomicrobiales bacterium]